MEQKQTKPKPCPFCGSENVSCSWRSDCVECDDCFASGPAIDGNVGKSIIAWNSAPRKQKKTKPEPNKIKERI